MDERMGELAEFEAEVEGFSGPFDALCWLVESRELEASQISVRQVVLIYGGYLANTGKVSLSVVFDFMLMAATLVLNKIRFLMPGREAAEEVAVPEDPSAEDVLERLSRYRPYRMAAVELAGMKESRDRVFLRENPDEGEDNAQYLGDLYALCRLWWSLEDAARAARSPAALVELDLDEWDGVPTSLPKEEQVDIKMSDIMSKLADHGHSSLSSILGENMSIQNLVLTLIALLEMSRVGRIRMTQRDLFGDVVVVGI
ncbi:MAG: segregation/condensation protein A [Synergistaceae bacterium]|nr:ScpA family protein [Synergistota bacterium]NLM70935.1 segregation/condensation protein A [Synergistaceae bacterium]